MKTAISIPDHVFKAAEELARRLGKSRSELYSAAIASYVDRHRQEGMTERLNEVYGPRKEQAELDAVLATLQSLSIPEEDWQVRRGEVWWVTPPPPVGSEPGHRRPVVIIQSDPFNRSRIGTAIAPHSTSNMRLEAAPGNVLLPRGTAGLDRDLGHQPVPDHHRRPDVPD